MSDERQAVGLVDTSTLIVLTEVEPALLPDRLVVSAVTMAELAVGPLVVSDPELRERRSRHVQRVEADFDIVPFDEDAARSFEHVEAALRRQGRKVSARAYDALIAATAISRGLPLYTCNPDDFAGIPGLEVVAVPHPDSP